MRAPVKEGLFTLSDAPRLLGGRCPACRRFNFPAQAACPYCSADGCETLPLSPRGVVDLCTTVINRPPGYDGTLPFGFGIVELPEGIRIVSRITAPEQARPGTTVRLILEILHTDAEGQEIVTYAFAPLADHREPGTS